MPEKGQQDPRFRKYVQLIERNLQSFDAVNEWADIISFLGRLLKSFQAYPQFQTIPHKHIVSKRLAQCLNPGFPAGVHQKTLEVYAYILETISKEQLAEDLPLWSVGLFPFIQYAATHVKPQLLNIFEKYYYPLGAKLRPAMRGFIIALLPALEEEGSEGFDKVVAMMDRLSNMVELPFFYSCIWLVLINDTNLRLPCLNYLLRRLPKITNTEDVALVLGGPENIGLMCRAFAMTLSDEHLLVQRGILELLVQNYALQHRTLRHDDLVILTRYALSIVLRKDMSLNRRLYAWLLGSDTTPQTQLNYFHHYAEKATTQAIQNLLFASSYATYHQEEFDNGNNNDISTLITDAQRPYKILISLMDKWEIGQPIVNNIFTDSLISLQGHGQYGLAEQEILQTANMWMEMVEPYLIWMKLFDVIDHSFPPPRKTTNSNKVGLPLVEFTLQSFKFTDDEIKHMHLPLVLTALTQKLQESIQHVSFTEILPQIIKCIDIILMLLRQLPDSVFFDRQRKSSVVVDESSLVNYQREFNTGMDALEYARDFYGVKRRVNGSKGNSINMDIDNDGHHSSTLSSTTTSNGKDDHEDEGDLTSQRTSLPTDDKTIAAITRPAFGPIRGSALTKVLTTHLIRFLTELVNIYVVAPDSGDMDGVDVGVDGKRLHRLDAQLEQVLHGACLALTMVAKHMGDGNSYDDNGKEDQLHLNMELTQTLLKCCQQSWEFGVVDAGLSTLTQLIRQQQFLDKAILNERHQVKQILNKLWNFLGPSTQLLHMRTVELLWLLTDTAVQHHVEAIVAGYLIVPDDTERMANYEKFGIFWELSENMVEASTVFSRPMFLMLDLLRDDTSPVNRRAAETWIRCHLKSYARLLEPFITTLLNRNIIRRTAEKHIPYVYQSLYPAHTQPNQQQHLTVSYFLYMRSFDIDIVDYMLTTLTTLIQFGGVGVLKACINYTVGIAGPMPSLIESGLGISAQDHPNLNFLELLVHIAIRFLESEPCDKLQSKLVKPVRRIQLHASDLLYLIISKLDHVDITITSLIQESVLKKLLFCISLGDLDIQPKLLHLLHATMAITAAGTSMAGPKTQAGSPSSSPSSSVHTKRQQHRKRPSTATVGMDDMISSSPPLINTSAMTSLSAQSQHLLYHPQNPSLQHHTQQEALKLARLTANLYVKCVIDAFHTPSNRSILLQWMDFVLVTLPHVRQGFRQVIVPVLICICEQINLCNVTVRLLMHGTADPNNTTGHTFDSTTKNNNHSSRKTTTNGLNWRQLNDGDDDGSNYRLPATTQPLIQEHGAVIGGPETDILVFLNGLEKVLCYCITDHHLSDLWSLPADHDSNQLLMPQVEDHTELWGLVQLMMQHPATSAIPTSLSSTTGTSFDTTTTTATAMDSQSGATSDTSKPRNALLFHLPVMLHILLDVWRVFRQPNWDRRTVDIIGCAKRDAVLQSFAYAADHVKARLETTFELLYKNCPSDVVEGFTEIFFIENPIALEYEVSSDHFQLISMELLSSIPTSSPQQIMTLLLDNIRQRTPGIPQMHRKRSVLRIGKLTDTSMLRFTEIYSQEMIKPEILATLWPSVHLFAKEYLSQASSYKIFLPGLLRFLTVMLEGVVRFSDDKKMRKDAQDLYQRCVDYCILIAGRSFDQSLWLRGRTNAYDDDHHHQQQHQETLLTSTTASSTISSPFATTLSLGSAGSGTTAITAPSIQPTVGTELFFNNATQSTFGGNSNDGDSSGIPFNLSTSSISELEKKASWKSREDFMIIQINHYMAINVIPQLRLLLGDQDRINSLLNNLVYYVIGPHLRSRSLMTSMPTLYNTNNKSKHQRGVPQQPGSSKTPSTTTSSTSSSTATVTTTGMIKDGSGLLHGGAVIVDQVVEMAKMPFTYKTWRKEVWDVFNDGRFFYMTRSAALKWCKILSTLFSLEKERFMELMGKIVTSATVNNSAFFTTSNKDQETWQRALNLRRVSFVIFAGTVDQFVPQLPSLQEKVVDLLKLDHSELVHVEIYLCLRILLVRFSQKHLINFWPVLISELMRLFNHVLSNGVHDKPEEAQIALGGCKFLDLLCTLELDSFQVYQWIFIRDTVEAVIQREKPNTVVEPAQTTTSTTTTLSIMDKLSDKLHYASLTSSSALSSDAIGTETTATNNNNALTMLPMDQEGGTMTDWPYKNLTTTTTNTMTLPSAGELRRPMLTMHNIGSILQLDVFIHHISLYVYQSSYMLAKPDLYFIEGLLLQDLLDGDMRTD